MTNDEFYHAVAGLLGTRYDCTPFTGHKRTRWNNRAAGSGRYPGFGMVRIHGDAVHVALRRPVTLHRVYDTKDIALADLKNRLTPAREAVTGA